MLAGTIAKGNPMDPYSEIDELSKPPNHGHRKTEIRPKEQRENAVNS